MDMISTKTLIIISSCVSLILVAGCVFSQNTAIDKNSPIGSASIQTYRDNGYVVVNLTNKIGSVTPFKVQVDFYHGITKLDSDVGYIKSISPGETDTVKIMVPPGTTHYTIERVSSVAGKTEYQIAFDARYS